jgi:hypothetical protein
MILYIILFITALYVIFVNLPQVYQFADQIFETDVFYSLCPKVENFQRVQRIAQIGCGVAQIGCGITH